MAGLRNLMIRLGIEVDPKGAGQGMAKLQGMMEKASAGIGIASGVALVGAFTQALDLSSSRGKIQAQLGVTAKESQRIGDVAGKLFVRAYGDSMEDVNTAVTSVIQNMDGMRKASSKSLEDTTARALTVSKVMNEDVGRVTRAVSQMMRTGLAKNSKEAFDILTRGQQLGLNKAEDLLDTFNEYPTLMRNLGINGKQAFGLISQGLQAGARDSDKITDALKEFSLRAVDGSKGTTEAFELMGLSASKIAPQIAAGGPKARKALDLVLDRLREMPDKVAQAQAIQGLFGGPGEDLGAAIFALDVDKASKSLDGLKGSTDAAAKAMTDTAAARFEAFKRTVTQNVVGVVDQLVTKFNELSPETQATITKFATIAAVAAPAGLVLLKVGQAAFGVGKAMVGGTVGTARFVTGLVKGSKALGENATAATKAGAALRSAGPAMANFGRFLGTGVVESLKMTGALAKTTAAGLKYTATMVAGATRTAALKVAQIAAGAASKVFAVGIRLVNAAMKANPIGIVITILTALVGLIILAYKKNETFRNIVNKVWKAIERTVMGAINGLISAFKGVANWFTVTLPNALKRFGDNNRKLWASIGKWIGDRINDVISGFKALGRFITVTVPNAFKSGVDSIGRFWGRVEKIAKNPVSFIVNTVYNKGIARMWNWVAEKVGMPRLPEIKGFAKGGILPGFSRKDDQIIAARSGEGILVPEVVKELGSDFIHHANAKGGLSAVANLLGFAGDPSALKIPGFENGGVVGFVKGFFGKAKDFFVNGFMKAVRGALNPIVETMKRAVGGTQFGRIAGAAVERVVNGIFGKFAGFENELGGGGGMKAVHAARSQIGVPYSWGGGGPGGPSFGIGRGAGIRGFDCSGLMEYAWFKATGKSIGGTTYEQLARMKRISKPRPGAVGQPHIDHTYMATERGGIIEAPYTGARVRETAMRHTPTWLWPAYKFDQGGRFEPGTFGYNGLREPEYVFTRRQIESAFEANVIVEVHVDPITGKKTYEELKRYKKANGNRKLGLD